VEWNRESGEFGDTGYGDSDAGSGSVDLAESNGPTPIETSEMDTVPNDFDLAPADFGAGTDPVDAGDADESETGFAETDSAFVESGVASVGLIDGETDAAEMAPAEIDLALDEIEKELAEVELALERLGDGTYGVCQTCGDALTEDELETAPAGRFCRAHLPFAPG
jgi:RNA polymerase-binding transcription factor DksA